MTAASPCSNPVCRNLTLHPSGLCHYHISMPAIRATPIGPMPAPGVALIDSVEVKEDFYPNGRPASRRYTLNGKTHDSPDGDAAWCVWDDAGNLVREEFHEFGELNNGPNGEPAAQGWTSEGVLVSKEFVVHGSAEDGPNGEPYEQTWDQNGIPLTRSHCRNGELHDPAGGVPAYQGWSGGIPTAGDHYINGRVIPTEDAEVYRQSPSAYEAVTEFGVAHTVFMDALHACEGNIDAAIALVRLGA